MSTDLPLPSHYAGVLVEIKDRVRAAQYRALRAVNHELVGLYWDIGRLIAQRQRAQGWGRSVVQRFAADLQAEFSGVRGFSAQNLWYMRQLYREYHDDEKLQPLVGEVSWSKNLVIMARCRDSQEREFYLRMTRKYGWTKSVLVHLVAARPQEIHVELASPNQEAVGLAVTIAANFEELVG
ncbi:MAG: DUF1016 domain-containing protein [Oligoflexia bacterium]|nr:DUF1016 domain-containing protein [Oligoflexia bacterium]